MGDQQADGVELTPSGAGGVRLVVRVKPGGRATRLVGVHAGALKAEVTAAPERGKANDAVVKLIAASLGVPRAHVDITAGHSGRIKSVVVHGATVREVVDRLRQAGILAIEKEKTED